MPLKLHIASKSAFHEKPVHKNAFRNMLLSMKALVIISLYIHILLNCVTELHEIHSHS